MVHYPEHPEWTLLVSRDSAGMGLEQLPRRFLGYKSSLSVPRWILFFFSSPSFVSQRKIGDYCVHSVLSRRNTPLLTSVSSRASSFISAFSSSYFLPPRLFVESRWYPYFFSNSQRPLLKREPVVSNSPYHPLRLLF